MEKENNDGITYFPKYSTYIPFRIIAITIQWSSITSRHVKRKGIMSKVVRSEIMNKTLKGDLPSVLRYILRLCMYSSEVNCRRNSIEYAHWIISRIHRNLNGRLKSHFNFQ